MIFVEPELNSIIINEIDFSESRNYMPEFVLALRELNPQKTIHFVVDLKKAPVMFIVYFRKLKETTPLLDLELYFKDPSKILPKVLQAYNLKYKNITEYPYELPSEDNIEKVVDPFEKLPEDSWMPLTSEEDASKENND